jgi:hypothetical protein
MSAAALKGLHAFADLYVKGRLAEDFAKQYGVTPCREYGIPERVGAVCGGGELVELIFKAERGRLKRGGGPNDLFLSMALVDWRLCYGREDRSQAYKAFDRVCIDLDIPSDCAQDRLCRAAKLGRLKARSGRSSGGIKTRFGRSGLGSRATGCASGSRTSCQPTGQFLRRYRGGWRGASRSGWIRKSSAT